VTVKRPAFQFYPKEWIWDQGLRECSVAARGLWVDMLCLMHEGEPYGHLTTSGDLLLRVTGLTAKQYAALLDELEARGVFSRTDTGGIFSRRMVRDEGRRIEGAAFGSQGGNPALGRRYNIPGFVYLMRRSSDKAVKIGIATNPTNRLRKVREALRGDVVELINVFPVSDMGTSEHDLHRAYMQAKVSAEWYALTTADIKNIGLTLKGQAETAPRGDAVNTPPGGQVEIPPIRGTEDEEKRSKEVSIWNKFKASYPAHRLDEERACRAFISRENESTAIVEGLELAVASPDWLKDSGKYVPKASRFIGEGMYLDFKRIPAAAKTVYFDPAYLKLRSDAFERHLTVEEVAEAWSLMPGCSDD